jgi:predicted AlkP superfamily pyrophosphatase or phosphodiesterase
MTRRCFLAAFGAATLLLPGLLPRPALSQTAPTIAPAPPVAEHVFIVSFDGGKPAVMKESRMPTVERMAREGAATWNAQTVLPSITLVSHTSMLTGVSPQKHHISWNEWEPDKGLVPVPTVFSVAKKANKAIVTAMFVGKQKFAHLFLPGSLDAFSMPDYEARIVARQAADYIMQRKPNLCFIHFADSDGAGHAYGWGSPEQVKAFADEDDALSVIRQALRKAGIEKTSLVILTADHGGHAKTHGSDLPEDMTIPWIAWGAGVKKGFTITDPVTTYDTAATALYALGVPIPADFDGKPVLSAFEPQPVPAPVTSR